MLNHIVTSGPFIAFRSFQSILIGFTSFFFVLLCCLGLQLILNANQDDYLSELGQTAGIRIVIHEQNKMPFPDENGITAIPGSMTILAIKQVRMNDYDSNDKNNNVDDNN